MLKKLYIFTIILYCVTQTIFLQSTMGDSSSTLLKNVTVYGRLETYVLPEKTIEQITLWNKQLKVNVYEAPAEWCTVETKKNDKKSVLLSFNPEEQGTVATIELQEIQSIVTPEFQNTTIFSKPDKTTQEFILIQITFNGNSSARCYLVDKRDKIFCKERNGSEIINLEIPIRSIKKLTIDGYSATDKQCS